MTPLDHVAAIAAGIACIFLGLRGEVLKPNLKAFFSAPPFVFLGLIGLSIAMAVAVVSIWWGGGHASAREAMVYSVLAVVSVLMFVNVHRQRPPAECAPPARAAWPPEQAIDA